MNVQSAILLATLALCTSTMAWADGTIRVSLTGERNQEMSVRLDAATVKAGNVAFIVTNEAKRTTHELILIKLKTKGEALPLDKAKHRIDEKQINAFGEISNLKPGATGQLKVNILAGDYLLICNIRGHYEAGMVAPFGRGLKLSSVTPTRSRPRHLGRISRQMVEVVGNPQRWSMMGVLRSTNRISRLIPNR
jgi:uncharacterized cupredoxin-like copper-binding protein